MNPFDTLNEVQDGYRIYVESFQLIASPDVPPVLEEAIANGELLWKEPFVQIARRFKKGAPLASLIPDTLHPDCRKVFYRDEADRSSPPIDLHAHQLKSIQAAKAGKNYLVSTGTSSGKSFCFYVPIVDDCLRMRGTRGIKAIIVYPMNALANSQYWNMARRLHGTGLKIGKFTGQTERTDKEAIEAYRHITGQEEPFDSEILSREKMFSEPPDILITNYKMLEYMLIRPQDRRMLNPEWASALRWIVLDEAHTYEGRRGADVAMLVRRLKRRMHGRGRIRCVATSATLVKSEDPEVAGTQVDAFFRQLFGEELGAYITEEEEALPSADTPIPATLPADLGQIATFDPDNSGQVWSLAERLLGRELKEHERLPQALSMMLDRYEGYHFLLDALKDRPKQVTELVGLLRERRPDLSEAQARFCVEGVLRLGLVPLDGKRQLIPIKLHSFFQSGAKIYRCFHCEYLSLKGEQTCPRCATRGLNVQLLPLHFCRCCGAELAGVTWDDTYTLRAWDMDQEEDREGAVGYFYRLPNPDAWQDVLQSVPEEWLRQNGQPRAGREFHVPVEATLDTRENTLRIGELLEGAGRVAGAIAYFPFKMCPACGVLRTEGMIRESNKLTFVTKIGRSTAVNVLTLAMLGARPDPLKPKSLIFCDVRQDAALQAGNMDDWYAHVLFRCLLHKVLRTAPEEKLNVRKVAERLFDYMDDQRLFEQYLPGVELDSEPKREVIRSYLAYCILEDLAISRWYTDVNLEEVGLLRVEYEGLEQVAADNVGQFGGLTAAQVYDLLLFVLEDLRRSKAYCFKAWSESDVFWSGFKRLSSHEEEPEPFLIPRGSSRPNVLVLTSLQTDVVNPLSCGPRSSRRRWVEHEYGNGDLLQTAIAVLEKQTFLVQMRYRDGRVNFQGYSLNDDLMKLTTAGTEAAWRCPKCGRVYWWRESTSCANPRCRLPLKSLQEYSERQRYYRELYLAADTLPPIQVEDHSQMVGDVDRVQREKHFAVDDQPLNALVCTPTMELGIDIGELSNVILRNVPPNPSNYIQRAGRAGRRGQGALAVTFCATTGESTHDRHFYRHPEQMIAGRILIPRFDLRNESLLHTHTNALLSEVAELELLKPNQDYFEPLARANDRMLSRASARDEFKTRLSERSAALDTAIHELFLSDPTLDCAGLEETFQTWRQGFWEIFEGHLNALADEHEAVNAEIDTMRANPARFNPTLMAALMQRLVDITTGGKERVQGSPRKTSSQHCPYAMDQWLAARGFIPGYAFGGDYITVQFPDSDDDFVREPQRALREFGPHALAYAHKRRWRVEYVVHGKQDTREFKRCECGRVVEVTAASAARCLCGKNFGLPFPAMKMPSVRVKQEMRISRWEDMRESRAFIMEEIAAPPTPSRQCVYQDAEDRQLVLSFLPKHAVTTINYRSRFAGDDRSAGERVEANLEHAPGFATNEEGRWVLRSATSSSDIEFHALYASGSHDALHLKFGPLEETDANSLGVTLRTALLMGLTLALRQGPNELRAFDLPTTEPGTIEILFYEATTGSAGALSRVLEGATLTEVVNRALEAMHFSSTGEDLRPDCATACYECLCDYFNQREQALLDRHIVRDILLWLASAEPQPVKIEEWDQLIASLSGSGAENEKRFLEILRDNGLPLPSRAHYGLPEEGIPIAEIDFQVGRVHVLVDGSIHHMRWVQETDTDKRDALRFEGYTILEFDMRELARSLQKLKELL